MKNDGINEGKSDGHLLGEENDMWGNIIWPDYLS